jgi:GT2 family glycosyltransferase
MYVEDLDICYRMWKKGWEVHYMPDSEVLHHIGGSSRRRSIPGDQGRKSKRAQIRASYRMQRSVFYFFWKNYKGSIKILLIPLLFMILGLRFLIAAIKSMVKR